MNKPETHLVTPENGPRPAGKPTECFYCCQPLGTEHKSDCVCRIRTIVLDFRIRVVYKVPEAWKSEDILFRYNESTWCAQNLIDELQDECTCDRTECSFVREATKKDEERYGITNE